MKGKIIKIKKIEHLYDFGEDFLKNTIKTPKQKELIKLDYIQIINICLLKAPEKELKHNPQKEHLQYVYLTKDFYSEYTKNFYNR